MMMMMIKMFQCASSESRACSLNPLTVRLPFIIALKISQLTFVFDVTDLGDRTKSFEKCLRMLDAHEHVLLSSSSSSVVAPLSIIQFPEMCFTGYTFDSREEIEPFVEWDDEEEEEAVTRQFLSSVAKRFDCLASAGYVRGIRDAGRKLYYNAVQVIDEAGRVILRANKHHLYCIDETWADEDIESGFTSLELVLKARGIGNTNSSRSSSSKVEEYRIKTTVGICMDINPYKFEAPWGAFEFAKTIEKASSSLILFASRGQTRIQTTMRKRKQSFQTERKRGITGLIDYFLCS